MLVKFFLTCNKIGAFTLGGGYAMIPIMEQEFVDKNKWMDKQDCFVNANLLSFQGVSVSHLMHMFIAWTEVNCNHRRNFWTIFTKIDVKKRLKKGGK